jgi:peptide chain release factor
VKRGPFAMGNGTSLPSHEIGDILQSIRCWISHNSPMTSRLSIDERLARLGVKPSDLHEIFTRSGGHGGQNVNKVSTAVILTHLPTGLAVRCETERTQSLNRVIARHRLCDRLERREEERRAQARHALERHKRQTRRPSHSARRRNVESKRRRGEIKAGRRFRPED